jgi:hypothetical protein
VFLAAANDAEIVTPASGSPVHRARRLFIESAVHTRPTPSMCRAWSPMPIDRWRRDSELSRHTLRAFT